MLICVFIAVLILGIVHLTGTLGLCRPRTLVRRKRMLTAALSEISYCPPSLPCPSVTSSPQPPSPQLPLLHTSSTSRSVIDTWITSVIRGLIAALIGPTLLDSLVLRA